MLIVTAAIVVALAIAWVSDSENKTSLFFTTLAIILGVAAVGLVVMLLNWTPRIR